MRKQLPMPVVIALIVLTVGGLFVILMQSTGTPEGAGNIDKLAAEIKAKEPPDFTPEQAHGGAVMRGQEPGAKTITKSSAKGKK